MTSQPLSRYPRPHVAVDVVILTVTSDSRLCVLTQERTSDPLGHVIPGSFLRERETTSDAVTRTLADKVGIQLTATTSPRLLRVFSEPDRDERAWTISLAHAVTVPHDRLAGARGQLTPVDASGDPDVSLLFDHADMVREAVRRMRAHYEVSPDPHRLLASRFTLSDLRAMHEAVLGSALRPDTFKRRMSDPQARHHIVGVVDRDGQPVTRSGGPGRPAQLFRQARSSGGPGADDLADSVQGRASLPRES